MSSHTSDNRTDNSAASHGDLRCVREEILVRTSVTRWTVSKHLLDGVIARRFQGGP